MTNLSLNSQNRLFSCSGIGLLLVGFLVFHLIKISFVKPEACAIIFMYYIAKRNNLFEIILKIDSKYINIQHIWRSDKKYLVFNFLRQISGIINIRRLQKSYFKNAGWKTTKFICRNCSPISPHCSKKDTQCKGQGKLAESRARRVKGNSVVGELLSSRREGNDDRPDNGPLGRIYHLQGLIVDIKKELQPSFVSLLTGFQLVLPSLPNKNKRNFIERAAPLIY